MMPPLLTFHYRCSPLRALGTPIIFIFAAFFQLSSLIFVVDYAADTRGAATCRAFDIFDAIAMLPMMLPPFHYMRLLPIYFHFSSLLFFVFTLLP